MPQPPSSPEVKKSSRLIAVAIVMLLIGVAIGVAIGWSIGQSPSQAAQSEYTRVKVLIGGSTSVTLVGFDYTFEYKYGNYNQTYPIEIHSSQATYYSSLPSVQGRQYNVLGLQVIISEVADTYVILLVKPL